MFVYFVFLFSYFVGIFYRLNKEKNLIGEENLLLLWRKQKKTIVINVGIIAPLFYNIMERYIEYTIPENVYKNLFVFCVNWVIYDFLYYFVHLLLHNKYFYKLHKKSHEIKERVSFSIYYCSSLEFLILELLPLYIGLIFFNANFMIYMYMTIVETLYRMKRLRMDVGIFHMKIGNCNFGVDLMMDKWMKTKHSRKLE